MVLIVSLKFMFLPIMRTALAFILGLTFADFLNAVEKPEFTDYCERLE